MFRKIKERLVGTPNANEEHQTDFSELEGQDIETADDKNLEALLDNYLETDSEDVEAEIVERSPESTPFRLVGERDEENHDDTKAHFLFPGFMSGPNETFTPVLKVFGGKEDVYAPDRTGDFSAEHAVNGIIDIIEQNPNYQKIEIFAVSVGAGIAKVLEEDPRIRAINESGREIVLTYYDPFDIDDFALGVNADKDSAKAKMQRLGVKIAASILPRIGKVLDSVVIKKGGSIGEDSSVGFLLGQFAALRNTHVINPRTGKFYYQDHIMGTIEAGTRGVNNEGEEDAEHFDVFMDKNQRNEKFGKAGIGVFLHAGGHGATEDNYPDVQTNPPRKNPTDAYRELIEKNNW